MNLGRLLIFGGLLLVLLGGLIQLLNRTRLPFGRLPGDILWRGKNSTFYFPWVTCLVLSALVSLVFWLFNRR